MLWNQKIRSGRGGLPFRCGDATGGDRNHQTANLGWQVSGTQQRTEKERKEKKIPDPFSTAVDEGGGATGNNDCEKDRARAVGAGQVSTAGGTCLRFQGQHGLVISLGIYVWTVPSAPLLARVGFVSGHLASFSR